MLRSAWLAALTVHDDAPSLLSQIRQGGREAGRQGWRASVRIMYVLESVAAWPLRGLRGPLLSAVVAAVEMRENMEVAGVGSRWWRLLRMLVAGGVERGVRLG